MTAKFVSASLTPLCRLLTVAEIPASSHYPMLEAPLLFAATLNAWIANQPLPPDIKVAVAEGG